MRRVLIVAALLAASISAKAAERNVFVELFSHTA